MDTINDDNYDGRLMRRTYDDKQEAHDSCNKDYGRATASVYANRLAAIQRREAEYLINLMTKEDTIHEDFPLMVGSAAHQAALTAFQETQWDHEVRGFSLDCRGILIDAARNLIFVYKNGDYKVRGNKVQVRPNG